MSVKWQVLTTCETTSGQRSAHGPVATVHWPVTTSHWTVETETDPEKDEGRWGTDNDPVKLIIRIIGELNLRAKEKGHGDDKKSVICFALNISFRLFAFDKKQKKRKKEKNNNRKHCEDFTSRYYYCCLCFYFIMTGDYCCLACRVCLAILFGIAWQLGRLVHIGRNGIDLEASLPISDRTRSGERLLLATART